MLEHQKMVLKGVSSDKALFRKELKKSLLWLNEKEQKLLSKWVKENFAHLHADVIMDELYFKLERA